MLSEVIHDGFVSLTIVLTVIGIIVVELVKVPEEFVTLVGSLVIKNGSSGSSSLLIVVVVLEELALLEVVAVDAVVVESGELLSLQ